MKSFTEQKVILWDFDGVILHSMSIRDRGFEYVLRGYPEEAVLQLMKYHRENGGISRYAKFRYFYEKILHQTVSEERIEELSASFSVIMRQQLTNPNLLIRDSVQFIKENFRIIRMHIISASDEDELKWICRQLDIDHFFLSIHGSPETKSSLIEKVMKTYKYPIKGTVYIGDTINDLQAANSCGLEFYGYNNINLEEQCDKGNYIQSFC